MALILLPNTWRLQTYDFSEVAGKNGPTDDAAHWTIPLYNAGSSGDRPDAKRLVGRPAPKGRTACLCYVPSLALPFSGPRMILTEVTRTSFIVEAAASVETVIHFEECKYVWPDESKKHAYNNNTYKESDHDFHFSFEVVIYARITHASGT